MITMIELSDILEPLEKNFKPLDDDKRETYFEHLKDADIFMLKKAVTQLLDEHDKARFPYIAEIKSAMRYVGRKRTYATVEELEGYCEDCKNTGYIIRENPNLPGYDSARPCHCVLGQKARVGWIRELKEKDKVNLNAIIAEVKKREHIMSSKRDVEELRKTQARIEELKEED